MSVDDGPWPARIARARRLAADHSSTAEALEFYAKLAEFQERLVRSMSTRRFAANPPPDPGPSAFIATLDQPRYRALAPKLLSWLQRSAPRPLAASAQRLLDDDPSDRQRMFDAYWAWAIRGEAMHDDTRAFVVEAVLQPFAESMARNREPGLSAVALAKAETGPPSLGGLSMPSFGASAMAALRAATAESRKQDESRDEEGEPDTGVLNVKLARCPACGGRPVVGLLREHGHGAKRTLVCGLCSTEWRVPRVTCPSCGEGRFDRLTTIRADHFPNARLDVCSTCRTYFKTLDLSRDNTMVASVDDLATLALDLWAREQGYTRLRPHLLRL
jgi:formate dehydrogenase maturation protein FdhE